MPIEAHASAVGEGDGADSLVNQPTASVIAQHHEKSHRLARPFVRAAWRGHAARRPGNRSSRLVQASTIVGINKRSIGSKNMDATLRVKQRDTGPAKQWHRDAHRPRIGRADGGAAWRSHQASTTTESRV
jgi:hypothetical protein